MMFRVPGAVRWIGAAGCLALVTVAGIAIGLNPNTVGFAYLIVVLLISVWGGLLIGTIASFVATLCYNFFFFPPLHTLTLADPANWFALAAFLVASVTVNRLVVAARIQAETAKKRRNELETLYGLSVDLFAATNEGGKLRYAAVRALRLLGARDPRLILFDRRESDDTTRAPEDIYLPLLVGGNVAGALVATGCDASREALESAGRLVALAIERERFIEESSHLQALRESESLKTSLFRAISHDLTSPITAINIRIESLRRRAAGDRELQDDVTTIGTEISRLRRRIDNLLAMARVEAGKATPRREPTPPADLFRAARENLPLAGRRIIMHVDDDCPDANVDPALALEILVNLVENAHRASPAGAAIDLVARRDPLDRSRMRIEVLDRGPGFAQASVQTQTTDVVQQGLGLEIARSLAALNDGTIALEARPDGGTIARIDLPAAVLNSSAMA